MQVILDYFCSSNSHVCGTVNSQRDVAVLAFDGWLDLMRLLEDLALEAPDVSPGPPSALSSETRSSEAARHAEAD